LNDEGKVHDLAAHLHETAKLAARFGTQFDSAGFAHCAGLWHDLGKNALDFQARLGLAADAHIENAPVSGRVDHSAAGAIHALDTLKVGLGLPLAFVIAGDAARQELEQLGMVAEPELRRAPGCSGPGVRATRHGR
jgi:CRISPR-associated endonuclease/helicase Cas3